MPQMTDHNLLEQIRKTNINIITGQGQWENPDFSRRMSQTLWDKGVSHNLDLWGHEWQHDWPTWKVMLDVYFKKLFY
jgi:esterase/lipase superfamily enzyme